MHVILLYHVVSMYKSLNHNHKPIQALCTGHGLVLYFFIALHLPNNQRLFTFIITDNSLGFFAIL